MAKRVVLIVFGVLLLVGGGICAIGGGALMALFGSDSTLTSGAHRVSTPTSALVAAMDDIKDTNGFGSVVGEPTLRVSVTGTGKAVFLGVGPAEAVDRYLAGVAADKVTDFDVEPFSLRTSRQDGTALPASPESQTFWTARSSGTSASVNWKISDGSYRLVLMNTDASAAIAADGTFALKIPNLFAVGVGALVGGIVAVLLGVLLLVLAARVQVRRRDMAGSYIG
jgi:hypothetical protein